MVKRKLTVELPESIFQHLSRIADLTHQPLEAIAAQSITSNLPPSADNASPEMEAELVLMQTLSIEELLKVARSKVPMLQQQRHLALLEQNQIGSLTGEERQELRNLGLAADKLMLRKAYAWAVLRWRGHRLPSLEELPLE